ncbi:PD40 domain-containing protein [Aggregatilinea lenta]|uniref:PD40 domain-containing protein n=1 Tax=Aggregatilinea lenta TaxID=913108 RepID=UPI000E5B006E|nr:PD40 domain-containing protein [Aggregatilinea lenta]
MKRLLPLLASLMLIALVSAPLAARAQGPYPLPAPLYILTSEQRLIAVDPATGEQTPVSPVDQPVADFAIAPDGAWYVYRTSANGPLVIVSDRLSGSGYVLDFEARLPPEDAAGPTIAWAGDVSSIAYLVPEGLRIAQLGGSDGMATFQTVSGGPWDRVTWVEPDMWAVADSSGSARGFEQRNGSWVSAALPTGPVTAQTVADATLTDSGVTLADGQVVPSTAGTLAFEWGPVPPPTLAGTPLPDHLYFLAADEAGIDQLWQLPADGSAAQALTASEASITAYAIAPQQDRAVIAAGGTLSVVSFGEGSPVELAQVQTDNGRVSAAWSADGVQIAFSDGRGLWTVPADGSAAPTLLIQNNFNEQAIASIHVYFDPRWSPDGTRLLVTIGLYEGSLFGVVDVADGALTELSQLNGTSAGWVDEGRVIAWTASFGYQTPGLYLADLTAPGVAQTILGPQYPVFDVQQNVAGQWLVLYGSAPGLGPQLLRALSAPDITGPYDPAFGSATGAYADQPLLGLMGQTDAHLLLVGLRGSDYDDQGRARGTLIVADLGLGTTVQIDTPGPVSNLAWGSTDASS